MKPDELASDRPYQEVKAVILDGAIHLKAVTKFGDPVELTTEEARDLAELLMALAREIG